MTKNTILPQDIESWLDKAFRGSVPSLVRELNHQREVQENVVREMMTQYDDELRDGMERLLELVQLQHAMTYTVVEELFKRHLEDHG